MILKFVVNFYRLLPTTNFPASADEFVAPIDTALSFSSFYFYHFATFPSSFLCRVVEFWSAKLVKS